MAFVEYQVNCLQKKVNKVKSLPNDKFLDLSELKAFADEKVNMSKKFQFMVGRVENIVGKGENASYQHFSPFPTMILKGFFLKNVKSRDCVVKS